MKRLFAALLLLALALGETRAQEAAIIKIGALEKMIAAKDQGLVVFNFWATWCAPCVKELPLFETLHRNGSAEVKVILVNLDFAEKVNKVNSFLDRKKITAPVYLLDEIDANSWIDRVEKRWNGSIPATLIVDTTTGNRKFVERELREGELEDLISQLKKTRL